MGRFFALTLALPAGGVKTKKTALKTRYMPKINFGVAILIFLGIFGILYLVEVNSISTKGYEIRTLEKRVFELSESAKRLQLEVAEQQSIQNIEGAVRVLNLVPSAGMNYLRDDGYALKR